nr:MAG TPA: vacuolar ATP synthase subunit S1 [Caudoviricetes sp.]
MLKIISGLILIIFGLIIVYLFSDEYLDRVEDKMIKNILKERIERSK